MPSAVNVSIASLLCLVLDVCSCNGDAFPSLLCVCAHQCMYASVCACEKETLEEGVSSGGGVEEGERERERELVTSCMVRFTTG